MTQKPHRAPPFLHMFLDNNLTSVKIEGDQPDFLHYINVYDVITCQLWLKSAGYLDMLKDEKTQIDLKSSFAAKCKNYN